MVGFAPIFYFNCEHFLFVHIIKQKQAKNVVDFKTFSKIEFCWRQIFENSIIHKPSLGPREVPHKIWARSVLPFWRLLETNKQTDKQSIHRLANCLIIKLKTTQYECKLKNLNLITYVRSYSYHECGYYWSNLRAIDSVATNKKHNSATLPPPQSPNRAIRTFCKHKTSSLTHGETRPLLAKKNRKHSKIRLCADTYTLGDI